MIVVNVLSLAYS